MGKYLNIDSSGAYMYIQCTSTKNRFCTEKIKHYLVGKISQDFGKPTKKVKWGLMKFCMVKKGVLSSKISSK